MRTIAGRQKPIAILLLIQLCAVIPASPIRAVEDCPTLVINTCTSCHYPERICEKLGEKSRRAWQVTIKRMLRYGLALDEAGQEHVLECLLALEDERGKLCR